VNTSQQPAAGGGTLDGEMDESAALWQQQRFAAIERVSELSERLDESRLLALLLGRHDTEAFDALIVELRQALAAYRRFRAPAVAERA
jgi:hypothetical protein